MELLGPIPGAEVFAVKRRARRARPCAKCNADIQPREDYFVGEVKPLPDLDMTFSIGFFLCAYCWEGPMEALPEYEDAEYFPVWAYASPPAYGDSTWWKRLRVSGTTTRYVAGRTTSSKEVHLLQIHVVAPRAVQGRELCQPLPIAELEVNSQPDAKDGAGMMTWLKNATLLENPLASEPAGVDIRRKLPEGSEVCSECNQRFQLLVDSWTLL